jgi:hypothetical protein
MQLPGDDTTIAVARIIDAKPVHLFTGPPLNPVDDMNAVKAFMSDSAKRIVCGGTSANIVARILNKKIQTSLNYADPDIPPIAWIEGIDLVTEGVLTLTRTLHLLRRYLEEDINENFFLELDKENGGSKIAKMIIEECTELHLYVGRTMNEAHQNPSLPFDLSIRMHLVTQLQDIIKKMGKRAYVQYY